MIQLFLYSTANTYSKFTLQPSQPLSKSFKWRMKLFNFQHSNLNDVFCRFLQCVSLLFLSRIELYCHLYMLLSFSFLFVMAFTQQ
ncbi:hypothetical protein LOK49_LG08G00749 [Camellia lanceoleosa]|uniref:Uncharacterized protein n=1 Tax=Camellia lanceoleosa TaxID=1840588 RepID=A0ACC0GYH2_9ERIC|nr:hypothetical protein LOK49_LG08G00749 [Camellia lanceoleosa]